MAISSTAAATITAVVSAASAVASGVAMYMQSEAQADQADEQQKALELQSAAQMEDARLAAAEKRTEAQRVKSKQLTAAAGTGVDLSSGSFEDIMTETSQLYERDVQSILRSGGMNSAATAYSAGQYDYDSTGAIIGAAGTTLKGLTTSYYYGDKAGWFDD